VSFASRFFFDTDEGVDTVEDVVFASGLIVFFGVTAVLCAIAASSDSVTVANGVAVDACATAVFRFGAVC
jgi:hypothetical protein